MFHYLNQLYFRILKYVDTYVLHRLQLAVHQQPNFLIFIRSSDTCLSKTKIFFLNIYLFI
jgi:hypothetical protein